MSGQGIYKVHKWLAVSVGAFFLAWLVSGIVMILPRLSAEPEGPSISDSIDIKKVSVSATESTCESRDNRRRLVASKSGDAKKDRGHGCI